MKHAIFFLTALAATAASANFNHEKRKWEAVAPLNAAYEAAGLDLRVKARSTYVVFVDHGMDSEAVDRLVAAGKSKALCDKSFDAETMAHLRKNGFRNARFAGTKLKCRM